MKYIYTNSEHCPSYLTPGKLYEARHVFAVLYEIVDDAGDNVLASTQSSSHLGNDPFHVLPDFYTPGERNE